MTPERPAGESSATPPADHAEPRRAQWAEKLAAILFCIFCLELGLFLLFFPWLGSLWNNNWFITLKPQWRTVLLSQEVRGAVSGLGILNLIVAFLEIIRLRRFAGR
ncbi:MAG: hypothetical protein HY858_01430 [Candidatus Solibacter usitatus]|nr:hypothetical protein [Candidatus Solibacter usitatus]